MAVNVFIDSNLLETRLAVMQNNQVREVYIERHSSPHLVGNIYLGKVIRILPGMQGAFIDIGLNKSAWLKLQDVNQQSCIINHDIQSRSDNKLSNKEQLREGQFILVQVMKEALGEKGPRVTMRISIASRHLVYTPFINALMVSKRIRSSSQCQKLSAKLKPLLQKNDGYIIRTQAKNCEIELLVKEANRLKTDWQTLMNKILEKAQTINKKVQCVYKELPMPLRFIRDDLDNEFEAITVDEQVMPPILYEKIIEFCQQYMPQWEAKIEKHQNTMALFDEKNIEVEIEQALQPQVPLPSGGYLVIESTEAMTTIDINSGSFVGDKSAYRTFFSVNLEAMQVIAKQIILRQLNGMILIDCIGRMESSEQKLLIKTLEKALKYDYAKRKIYGFTALGLLEMTRQRVRHSLIQSLTVHCPFCEGMGSIDNMETVTSMIFKELDRLSIQYKKANLVLSLSNVLHDWLKESRYLDHIIDRFNGRVSLRKINSHHPTEFKIVME